MSQKLRECHNKGGLTWSGKGKGSQILLCFGQALAFMRLWLGQATRSTPFELYSLAKARRAGLVALSIPGLSSPLLCLSSSLWTFFIFYRFLLHSILFSESLSPFSFSLTLSRSTDPVPMQGSRQRNNRLWLWWQSLSLSIPFQLFPFLLFKI